MNYLTVCFLITFMIYVKISLTECAEVHYLHPGEEYKYTPVYRTQTLHIFCYKGKPKSVLYLWQTVFLRIETDEEFTQYEGPSPEFVTNEYKNNHYGWSLNLFFNNNNQKTFKLDPFNGSCLGIDSKDPYKIHLHVIRIDFWKVLYVIIGIFLFLSADKLSANTIFYYACGISFGICASFLILIYFVSKLFPRKPLMYGVLGCGWTVVIYFLQMLWENLRIILLNYKAYVIYYILSTGFISFIIFYRWGPIENQRTRNLIRWTLQICGLVLMFFSSHYQEAAMGQIVILLLFYNLPKKWVNAPHTYFRKKFPPKVKLLSNDEYYQQGVKETEKALKELRDYCSSPECNQWKMALKLKDVKRFASFIEGNSHLSDEEILEYETSLHELTDRKSVV